MNDCRPAPAVSNRNIARRQEGRSRLCYRWDEKLSALDLGHASAHVDLALDLLTSPASSLDGSRAVLASCAGLTNEGGDPVVAEVSGKLTVGESIGKITVKS